MDAPQIQKYAVEVPNALHRGVVVERQTHQQQIVPESQIQKSAVKVPDALHRGEVVEWQARQQQIVPMSVEASQIQKCAVEVPGAARVRQRSKQMEIARSRPVYRRVRDVAGRPPSPPESVVAGSSKRTFDRVHSRWLRDLHDFDREHSRRQV